MEAGLMEKSHIVSGSWIAWLIHDSIRTMLSVPFCPYHCVCYHFVRIPFCPYHFVLEPSSTNEWHANNAVQAYTELLRLFVTILAIRTLIISFNCKNKICVSFSAISNFWLSFRLRITTSITFPSIFTTRRSLRLITLSNSTTQRCSVFSSFRVRKDIFLQ